MTTESGQQLTAKDLMLMPRSKWQELSAMLTDSEREELSQKLFDLGARAASLSRFLTEEEVYQ